MSLDLFDSLLNFTTPETDDLPIDGLLKNIQETLQPARYTTPIYEQPELKSDYEKSSPFPTAYKADVNTRKGIITAYLSVYNDADGKPYVDPYMDIIENTAFDQTVQQLEKQRNKKNNPWLVPDLWQHDRKEVIGGIKGITLDRRGPIYEAHLTMGVKRAREALELAEQRAVGSSFGYDPVRFKHVGEIRHLLEVRLHEVSQVTFPANDFAPILGVKSRPFYVPSSYKITPSPRLQQQQKERERLAALRTTYAMSLFDRAEKILNRTDKVAY